VGTPANEKVRGRSGAREGTVGVPKFKKNVLFSISLRLEKREMGEWGQNLGLGLPFTGKKHQGRRLIRKER